MILYVNDSMPQAVQHDKKEINKYTGEKEVEQYSTAYEENFKKST